MILSSFWMPTLTHNILSMKTLRFLLIFLSALHKLYLFPSSLLILSSTGNEGWGLPAILNPSRLFHEKYLFSRKERKMKTFPQYFKTSGASCMSFVSCQARSFSPRIPVSPSPGSLLIDCVLYLLPLLESSFSL